VIGRQRALCLGMVSTKDQAKRRRAEQLDERGDRLDGQVVMDRGDG
jgi:hypothetical protein